MYVLNVSICASELVFSSGYSVLVSYNNDNTDSWGVETQLKILSTSKQPNKTIKLEDLAFLQW